MKKAPTIWSMENLCKYLRHGPVVLTQDHRQVPARTIGYFSFRNRLKAAWLVYTGKADALIWPEGQ
jgi:hypothetical protein